MTMSFPSTVRGWWQPGARFLVRVGRRTLVDSLYLLTAPVTAAAGLLLVLGGLIVATAGLLLPRRSPLVASVLAPARWLAGLERWRIATVRSPAGGPPYRKAFLAERAVVTLQRPLTWLRLARCPC